MASNSGVVDCQHCHGHGDADKECCRIACGASRKESFWEPVGTHVCCNCLGAGKTQAGRAAEPKLVQCRHCYGSGSTSHSCCRIACGAGKKDGFWSRTFDTREYACCSCQGTGKVYVVDPRAGQGRKGTAAERRLGMGGNSWRPSSEYRAAGV